MKVFIRKDQSPLSSDSVSDFFSSESLKKKLFKTLYTTLCSLENVNFVHMLMFAGQTNVEFLAIFLEYMSLKNLYS